ncbi:hypothetical protein K440DRAFT_662753 [Wilcoxina mikolae CBS 423.85]|nr:hypothetical protein K440DRAFT_662753 [Wilcoxina mikolae CBS 423.85]
MDLNASSSSPFKALTSTVPAQNRRRAGCWTVSVVKALAMAGELDLDLDLPLTPAQESALDILEDRLDIYDSEALDSALETATATYTDRNTRLDGAMRFAVTQTIVTGTARESFVSDLQVYISAAKEVIGVTTASGVSGTTGSSTVAGSALGKAQRRRYQVQSRRVHLRLVGREVEAIIWILIQTLGY